MEIKLVPESDMQMVVDLSSQAFVEGDRRTHTPNPEGRHRDIYGVYDSDGLEAKVVVIDFRSHFGENLILPMGGVAGVACLPEKRGRGYVGACLDYSLERMREKGQVVSILFPFAMSFYQKHGWDWTGASRSYSIPPRILKSVPETENVRAAGENDYPAISRVYTAFAQRYRGMNARSEKDWNDMLGSSSEKHTYTYIYEKDGKVEGYLTNKGWKKKCTKIREFVCLTKSARKALLGLMRRHEMQIDRYKWRSPEADLLWNDLSHWDVETSLWPTCQSRVVDVKEALQALHPSEKLSGTVVFQIHDEHAPWNEGVWEADVDCGKIVVNASQKQPQVEMDIKAFSQAYFGTPSLSELRRAESIDVYNEKELSILKDILDGPPMWINDFF